VTPETSSVGELGEAAAAHAMDTPEATAGTSAATAEATVTTAAGTPDVVDADAEGPDEAARTTDGALGTDDSVSPVTGDDAAPGTGDDAVAETGGEPPESRVMSEISGALRDLADSSQHYHARAEQREGVIDHLRSEVEVLRRGERRGLLRPVLTDMCRLRNDLLRQAAELPADYDAAKAAELLLSYAESIQLTLESNGVIAYAPNDGEPFDPRMHRRVAGETSADPALAGRIANVRRDGYLDIEANNPIAPAEVTVFAATKGEQ
jgi:molecular chaperone GrpE